MAPLDAMAYQRAYDIWRKDAADFKPNGVPYTANFRSLDILSTAEFATGDNGTNKTKDFFQTNGTLASNPLYNTGAPSWAGGANSPNTSFFGLYGVALLMDIQYSIITNLNAIVAGVGSGKLVLGIGSNYFIDWATARFLQSYSAGYYISNDNAATSLVARANFVSSDFTPLPNVKNLPPGTQLQSQVRYTIPTITVAFNLTLMMHMFAADQGTQ